MLFGGTFDPFHKGHEAIAKLVLATEMVDELRLIPCAIPALKAAASASPDNRLAMLEVWKQTQSNLGKIVVDPIELEKGGTSFTVDTVEALHNQYPGDCLVFVLGADAWNSLPRWHRIERLSQLVGFWVFARTGDAAPEPQLGIERTLDLRQFFTRGAGCAFWDQRIDMRLSSTALRESPVDMINQTPEVISDYIKRRHLYSNHSGDANTEVNE